MASAFNNLTKMAWQGAFQIGYTVYKTRIGETLHQHACAESHECGPHSKTASVRLVPGTHISIVPILGDNYCYLIVDEPTKTCLAVDPSDADEVLDAVQREGLILLGVLTTHAHWDHAGGNEAIRQRCPDVKIYGTQKDQVPGMTDAVVEGDMFWFPPHSVTPDPQLILQVWETPCHTRGHVMYILCSKPTEGQEGAQPTPVAVFTGDTLFSGGTGKFFEGSAQEMHDNLVFCGHEYTLTNYKYAAALEPDNMSIQQRLDSAMDLRRQRTPTVPTTIAEELLTNPYLRVATSKASCGKIAMALFSVTQDPSFKDGKVDSVAVLAEVRRVRDDNLLKDQMNAVSKKAESRASSASGAAPMRS